MAHTLEALPELDLVKASNSARPLSTAEPRTCPQENAAAALDVGAISRPSCSHAVPGEMQAPRFGRCQPAEQLSGLRGPQPARPAVVGPAATRFDEDTSKPALPDAGSGGLRSAPRRREEQALDRTFPVRIGQRRPLTGQHVQAQAAIQMLVIVIPGRLVQLRESGMAMHEMFFRQIVAFLGIGEEAFVLARAAAG